MAAAKSSHGQTAADNADVLPMRVVPSRIVLPKAPDILQRAADRSGGYLQSFLRRQVRQSLNIGDAKRIAVKALRMTAFYVGISLIATTLVVAAGAMLFADRPQQTAAISPAVQNTPATPAAPAADPWVRLSRPIALYSIDAPEFAKLPQTHQARRHSFGNGREDKFTVGSFDNSQFYFALRIYRPGGEVRNDSTQFVETVRHASEEGLTVARLSAADQHRTKFGRASVADVTIQQGAHSRNCLTFRLMAGDSVLDLSGLACGAESKPLDRAALTCFIDRIALMASGDDAALRDVFSNAELTRHAGCTKSSLTSAGRKASWLDVDGVAPALKTSVADHIKPEKKSRKSRSGARE